MIFRKKQTALVLAISLFALGFKQKQPFYERLAKSAVSQTKKEVRYVPAYVRIKYPNGDVPENTGVCTDLLIRAAYRGVGIDLQKEVHEDMVKRFKEYPQFWQLKNPDTNIDHRRVPNLMTFFNTKKLTLK